MKSIHFDAVRFNLIRPTPHSLRMLRHPCCARSEIHPLILASDLKRRQNISPHKACNRMIQILARHAVKSPTTYYGLCALPESARLGDRTSFLRRRGYCHEPTFAPRWRSLRRNLLRSGSIPVPVHELYRGYARVSIPMFRYFRGYPP